MNHETWFEFFVFIHVTHLLVVLGKAREEFLFAVGLTRESLSIRETIEIINLV